MAVKYTKLKHIRIKREMTQADLAEKSGVPLKTIQAYESRVRDINHMTLENAYKLARALNCRMESLMDLERITIPNEGIVQ